jgi:nucleoside-diphosphate-sugar epimerase
MTTVAVTGVAGFIGDAVARRYADAGATVRGMDVRLPDPGNPLTPDADPRVEYLVGDVTDLSSIRRLVDGADIVVHTAAIVAESGDWRAFDRVNAQAPRWVALAARAAGAQSFVHLSSVMVHGFDFDEGCAEDHPFDAAANPYCASKIRAEFLLRDLSVPGEFRVHIVRPGDVYGPYSTPWIVRPIQHMRDGTFLYVQPSAINHVYIDNLLDAIDTVIAAGDDMAGVPVIASDGVATPSRDFYGYYADALGMGGALTVPGWLAEPVAGALTGVLPGSLRRRLDLDRESIRYLRRHHAYSNERLRSLGWEPRIGLRTGREITAAWLRRVGLLPAT